MKEQMRAEFESLSSEQLQSLYFKFVEYRDSECNGMAQMSVQEFYRKYGA